MPFPMYDSINLSEIPSSATAVAGYVGGRWPTYSKLATDFPKAQRLSIAVNAEEDAECLDIESGDASPSQAPRWFKRQKSRGVAKPCFYASAAIMPAVVSVLTGAGIKRGEYRLWTAHYTFAAHIEPGSDATQWTDRALGRNLDESLCADGFLGAKVVTAVVLPPIVNPVRYNRFAGGTFLVDRVKLSERATVQAYDRLRAKQTPSLHPSRAVLAVLRHRCNVLAGRVARVAQDQPRRDGRPSWNVDARGWRYQQLIHRAQGQRFV